MIFAAAPAFALTTRPAVAVRQWVLALRTGIDWPRVAAKAKAKASGMPHQTHDELVEVLCAEGFSTRDDVYGDPHAS